MLLTPRVQLTHKSNGNVENCAGFMKGKKKNNRRYRGGERSAANSNCVIYGNDSI